MNKQQIEHNFTYHRPNEGKQEKHQKIREKGKEFALLLLDLVPDTYEQTMALTFLETTVFWANAGIARGEME